jgi:hypothetical protein
VGAKSGSLAPRVHDGRPLFAVCSSAISLARSVSAQRFVAYFDSKLGLVVVDGDADHLSRRPCRIVLRIYLNLERHGACPALVLKHSADVGEE